ARTWDRVLPSLHAAGRRTIVPYLRGCGPTRFRSSHTPRNGQLVALGQHVLDLADAMELQTFAVVGHDWGARAAYIASAFGADRSGLLPRRGEACAGPDHPRPAAGHPRRRGPMQRPRYFRGEGALLRLALRAHRPRPRRPFPPAGSTCSRR